MLRGRFFKHAVLKVVYAHVFPLYVPVEISIFISFITSSLELLLHLDMPAFLNVMAQRRESLALDVHHLVRLNVRIG